MQRITQSLHLSGAFPAKLKGYCWDTANEKKSQHLGMMFEVNIENPHTAVDLKNKEYRQGRGHSITGGFRKWETLEQQADELRLESWSRAVLGGLKDFRGLKRAL